MVRAAASDFRLPASASTIGCSNYVDTRMMTQVLYGEIGYGVFDQSIPSKCTPDGFPKIVSNDLAPRN